MEDSFKYFRVENKGRYCSIHCALLEDGVESFKDKRGILVELRRLEKVLAQDFFLWNSFTKLTNPVMMRLFWKLGAEPYHIDLEHNSIWFRKFLRR